MEDDIEEGIEDGIDEQIAEQRYTLALALAVDRYRRDSSPENRERIGELRPKTSAVLWCSPTMGLDGSVEALAIHPDGAFAIAGGPFSANRVLRRDLRTGEVTIVEAELEGDGVQALAYSPDGTAIAIASTFGRRLYLYRDGECALLGECEETASEEGLRLSFSASGRAIAVGLPGRPVDVYSIDGSNRHELPGQFLAFQETGIVICELADGALVEVEIDHGTSQSIPVLKCPRPSPDHCSCSSRHLLYPVDEHGSREYRLCNLASGKETVLRSPMAALEVALSAALDWLTWISMNQVICRNIQTGAEASAFGSLWRPRAEFAGGDSVVVVGQGCRVPRVFQLPERDSSHGTTAEGSVGELKERFPIHGHTSSVDRIRFLEEGATLESESDDGTRRRWDVATGAECLSADRRDDPDWTWSDLRNDEGESEGGTLIAGTEYWYGEHQNEDSLTLFDAQETRRYPLGGEAFAGVHLPEENAILLSVDSDDEGAAAVVFDLESRSVIRTVLLSADSVGEIATDSARSIVVIGTMWSGVALFDYASGERLECLPVSAPVQCVDVSPDGRYVACGTDTGSVIVWQLRQETTSLGDLEASELEDLELETLERSTGAKVVDGELSLRPCPGSHYVGTPWARYCQEQLES